MPPRRPLAPPAATAALRTPPPPVHLGRTRAPPAAATTAGRCPGTGPPRRSALRCPSVATPPRRPVAPRRAPVEIPQARVAQAARARQAARVATPGRLDPATRAGQCPATAPPPRSAL